MENRVVALSILFGAFGLFVIVLLWFFFYLGFLTLNTRHEGVKVAYRFVSDSIAYTGPLKEREICDCGTWCFPSVQKSYRFHNVVVGIVSLIVISVATSLVSCFTYTCFDGNKWHELRIAFFAIIAFFNVCGILILYPFHEVTNIVPSDPCFCINVTDNKLRWLGCLCCKLKPGRSRLLHEIGTSLYFFATPVFSLILAVLDWSTSGFHWFFVCSIVANGIAVVLALVFLCLIKIREQKLQTHLDSENDTTLNNLSNLSDEEKKFLYTVLLENEGMKEVAPVQSTAAEDLVDLSRTHRDTLYTEYFLCLAVVLGFAITITAECAVVFVDQTNN